MAANIRLFHYGDGKAVCHPLRPHPEKWHGDDEGYVSLLPAITGDVPVVVIPRKVNPKRQMSGILITGGSGFIGTNLMQHYLVSGHEVINLDIAPPRDAKHMSAWRETNILDHNLLRKAVTEFSPAVIFH